MIYKEVQTIEEMQAFMDVHTFAVCDFMALLGSLRQRFAPSGARWAPPKNRLAARIINDITLGEETDSFPKLKELTGQESMSHAEMYSMAMKEVGANLCLYEQFIQNLGKADVDPFKGLHGHIDKRVEAFVRGTLSFCDLKQPDHVTASAFFFGREDLIAPMFSNFLGGSTGTYFILRLLLRLII